MTRIFITFTSNLNNMTYRMGNPEIVVALDKSLKVSEAYSFYLYNDQLMLMDYDETGTGTVERNGRSLKMQVGRNHVWLPGDYFLLMRPEKPETLGDQGVVLRADVTLDAEGTFHVSPFRGCGRLSLEDLLSGRLCKQKGMWRYLSERPGMMPLKQRAIQRARAEELNTVRGSLTVGRLEFCNNFLVAYRKEGLMRPNMTLFKQVMDMEGELHMVDCQDLYDATNNNPYEKLNEVFQREYSETGERLGLHIPDMKSRIYCFYHIGTLMDTGGKVIMRTILRNCPAGQNEAIFLGTQAEIQELLEQNPSLGSHFPPENRIQVAQPTCEELIHLFFRETNSAHLPFAPEAVDKACRLLTEAYRQGTVASWDVHDVRRFIERSLVPRYCQRSTQLLQAGVNPWLCMEVAPEDLDEQQLLGQTTRYEDTLAELNQMVGLADVKQSLTTIANNMHLYVERQQLGLHTSSKTVHHAIFMGNPGTGKTTVARLLGKIYHSLGLLSKGDVICVDRTKIIGRYIGETEENMKQILQEARGNVLFVDEAYTLYSNDSCNDFGKRAVECLLNVLTQKNPDMLIIFAGYQDEMNRLMSMNPGLVGRFPYKFLFSDYNADELMQIAQTLLARDEYQLTDEAARQLLLCIRETIASKSKNFGNARWIEQFVSNGIIPALADRLATTVHPFTREVYQRIEPCDIQQAYQHFNPKTIELKPRRQVGFSA